tara:strand:- start:1286 stop:1519 length:234 start_codon:yes stop_codon:yes gene_type:complete
LGVVIYPRCGLAFLIPTLINLSYLTALMGRHVSVVMRDDLFTKMERERGRESRSSFVNHIIDLYFNSSRLKESDPDA